MQEDVSTNKNLAEKGGKFRNKLRKLTGFISILMIAIVSCYGYNISKMGAFSFFGVIFLVIGSAPVILTLMLINFIMSIQNIKRLDKIDWFLFILNSVLIISLPFLFVLSID